jgi:phosphonopyruvate decarboxylase
VIKIINCEQLYESFKKEDLNFFTGVPDSTFKDWMKFLADEHGERITNIVACNECEAISIATGYHLKTGKVGIVYMQNSGEGKTINPLTSLCDKEVYSIPMLLMIGWRGEPGKKDEPQHKKMGRVMIPLLESLEINYKILPNNIKEAEKVIEEMKKLAEKNKEPIALIIKKGTFEEYNAKKNTKTNYEMCREDAIKTVIDEFEGNEAVVSTTGKTSRELFEYREKLGQDHSKDFLTVGSMGCSAAIANGIALSDNKNPVFVFDGDGALIMQMGSLATIGYYQPKKLYHIVFDNESYDSTGGQPTVSSQIDFEKIALACNYKNAQTVETRKELKKTINKMKTKEGPQMIIVKINKGARKELGRPTTTPIENKESFMEFLKK